MIEKPTSAGPPEPAAQDGAEGPCASQSSSGARNGYGDAAGFTLLEVLVAVAILSISLTSLLTSQMNAMRATRYAQSITAMAFLAESKLVDIEWEIRDDGWGDNDKEFEGDFSEEGWPDVRYECIADMIEMPEYTQLQRLADASEEEDEPGLGGVDVQDAGETAFDSLAMVWPIVKEAVERAIRKASCTVYWTDGKIQREFRVDTYWTDPAALAQLPALGGEASEDDDTDDGDDGGGGTAPGDGGTPPGSAPRNPGQAPGLGPSRAGGR